MNRIYDHVPRLGKSLGGGKKMKALIYTVDEEVLCEPPYERCRLPNEFCQLPAD
jgi:hypothetical protein